MRVGQRLPQFPNSFLLLREPEWRTVVLSSVEKSIKPAGSLSARQAEAKHARAAGLVYVADTEPGLRRLGRRTFRYINSRGKQITDRRQLKRIAALAIPPAYTHVWICADPRGHLQATGRDVRGRKQYRYHPAFRAIKDAAKFERMLDFGAALPRLRRCLRADLKLPGLPRDKVLAAVVGLLADTKIRIGNAEYARTNRSYGLTTLRNRHAKTTRSGTALRFRGKGGVEHDVKLDDRRLANIVHGCQELPGQHLFQFLDEQGQAHHIDSTMVNEYLHCVMGQEFTAKDFRTWNATQRAIELLGAMPVPDSERGCKACSLAVVKQIASELRNTPAVCRKSYINPLTFIAWQNGKLRRLSQGKKLRKSDLEHLTLAFLRQCRKGRVFAMA
jgi:DNA topoisomerase I